MEATLTTVPPAPVDDWEDTRRIMHTRLRRRMMYGNWKDDSRQRLWKALGVVRQEAVGDPDLSANAFRSISSETAALYDDAADVINDEEEAATSMGLVVKRAGLWPLMQRFQRDGIALREMYLGIDVSLRRNGTVQAKYRPVFPDMVDAVPDPQNPEQPMVVREWTIKRRANGRREWTREVWNIEDLDRPFHQVLAKDDRTDISHEFGLPPGGLHGDDYLMRNEDGPIIPYVLHHAARTGCLLDPYEGMEVVEGTLQTSVFWSFYGHLLLNASWAQRWLLGVEPEGVANEGTEGNQRQTLITDPAVIVKLKAMFDAQGQPQVGQWNAASDPKAFAESIGIYERRLASFAGLDPSDIQRVSGDPRSGYAIAIGQAGREKAQQRYKPVFEIADREVLEKTATLINVALGYDLYPTSGWDVAYKPINGAANSNGPKLTLTPSDYATISTVNEGRASAGLPALTKPDGSVDPDGNLTIAQYKAKYAVTVAQAANAEAGDPAGGASGNRPADGAAA